MDHGGPVQSMTPFKMLVDGVTLYFHQNNEEMVSRKSAVPSSCHNR